MSNIKKHLISALITFISTFGLTFGLAAQVPEFTFQKEAFVSLVWAATVAGMRAISKLVVQWITGYKS